MSGMARQYAALFVAAAVAVAAVAVTAESTPAYEQTFEKDNKGWTIEWDNDTISATASFTSGQAAHKSEKGVRITATNPEAATTSVRLVSPQLELEADSYYTFRFRALSKPKAPVQVLLYSLNETGTWYISKTVPLLSVWRQVSLTFQPAYSTNYRFLLAYGKNLTGDEATLYFDTFTVWDGLFSEETGEFMSNEQMQYAAEQAAERAAFEADQEEMRKQGPTELVIGDGGELLLQPLSKEGEPKVVDRPAVAGVVTADETRKQAANLMLEKASDEESKSWTVTVQPEEEGDRGGSKDKGEEEEEEEEEEETINVDMGSDGDVPEDSEDEGESSGSSFANLSTTLLTTESDGLARGSSGAAVYTG